MEWSRSNALAVSTVSCAHCNGEGLRRHARRGTAAAPCNCTTRNIFRACMNKFRECVEMPASLKRATLQASSGIQGYRIWGRKNEEYCADFYLIAKRTLDEEHFQIFRFHFLLGADWKLCCRRLGMDRGNFFHAVYRIQQQLGRAYAETEPFALFPLDQYFGVEIRRTLPGRAPSAKVIEMPPHAPAGRIGLRVPTRAPIAA